MQRFAGVTWNSQPGGKELILADGSQRVSIADPARANAYQHAEGISRYLKNKFSQGAVAYSFDQIDTDAKPLATFESGKPAIVSRQVQKGTVISSAVPFEEFLFTAVNLHDPRGENYVRQLIAFADAVLTKTKVQRPFSLNRLGDTQFDRDNVMAFYRKPANDDSTHYLFLVNTGHAVNGKYGSIHYALSPYTHENTDAITQISLPTSVTSVHELLRNVDVKTLRTPDGVQLKIPLHAGQCYVLKLNFE